MNYNVIASIRKDKINNKGLAPVYIQIYEGRKLLKKESTGQKVNPDLWISELRQVNKKHPNAMLINALITKKIADIELKILNAEISGEAFSNEEKIKDGCFFEFAEKQISEKNYAPETRRSYTVYVDKIKSFKSSLKLSQIDYIFLQSYEAHLRETLKNAPNTIWSNIKFLNTMTNDAVKCNRLKSSPFEVYKRPRFKQTPRTYLTADEIGKIERFVNALTDADKKLKVVGNYFLFMAYTGLRYSDATRFNHSHIINKERIVIEMQKTKKITNLLINDKIRPCMDFILLNSLDITPIHFNRKLKTIAACVGITKEISSHVGRHSFGAQLVALGVPEKHAQGLLGHGNPASTKIYYHLDNSSLDEAMRKFNK